VENPETDGNTRTLDLPLEKPVCRSGKGQFSFQSQRKAMPKNAQTTAVALISHTSKVIKPILSVNFSKIRFPVTY